jgi:hypothetical protein
MQYYRCKCGERWSMSSMGVQDCITCDKCGSTLAQSPSSHGEPIPHDIRAEIQDGKVRCFCIRCLASVGTLDQATNAEEIREQVRQLSRDVAGGGA